jgi:CDP-6-deoxy-D-xylo-4-hexulose-3-dehydrase
MASIGLEQLKKADKIKEKRYNNVKFLNEELSFIENIIKLPLLSADVSYLAYPLIVKNVKGGRGKITSYLEKMGIETRPLFTCIPFHQPSYQKYKDIYKDKLKNAEYLGLNGFYIGCHQFLSENDLKYIVQIFKSLKYLLK